MKAIMMKAFVGVLRFLYKIAKKVIKTEDKVSVLSRQSDAPSDDIILLKNELQKRGVAVEILTLKLDGGPARKLRYLFHIFRQMKAISSSRTVILDGYCIAASVLEHKPGTKIIQMWHAMGAVKKFGWQTVGKKSGSEETTAQIMSMHKGYDIVLAPSKVTAKIYMEAFNTDDSHIRYGILPSAEKISIMQNVDGVREIKAKYPNLYKPVLYAPTFRKNSSVALDEIISEARKSGYDLIVKMHPGDRDQKYSNKNKHVIFDKYFTSRQWLGICEKVITDYSAIVFEAALCDKPVYFYVYDKTEYEVDPGLNIDPETEPIGKYAFRSAKDLLRSLGEPYDYDALAAFRRKYIEVSPEGATAKLADIAMPLQNRVK